MYKRRKTDGAMWINPRSNLNRRPSDEERGETDQGNARYLDLADVALRPKTQLTTASTLVKSDDGGPRQIAHPTGARTDSRTHLQRRNGMKTTISIQSPLEHEILDWAINSDFFGATESNFPSGWSSWDRKAALTTGKLEIDWATPQIAAYAAFILMRLQDLYSGERDKYAMVAKELEQRIRRKLRPSGPPQHC